MACGRQAGGGRRIDGWNDRAGDYDPSPGAEKRRLPDGVRLFQYALADAFSFAFVGGRAAGGVGRQPAAGDPRQPTAAALARR